MHLTGPAVKDLADHEFSAPTGSIGRTAARELAEVCAYRATERLA